MSDLHPADVQFRAPQLGDTAAAGVSLPRPDEETWLRTRVAVADGRCIGAASLNLWPATDSFYCEVTVAPDFRRRGLGTRLYGAVWQTIDRPFRVLARAMASQPIRRQFAESLGCSVLFHCPEPWVDPTSREGQQWIDGRLVPAGYILKPMSALSPESVGQAWAGCFVWTHEAFGVVHADRLPAMWLQLAKEIDPAASRLAVDASSGEIEALSLVMADVWDGRTMIVSETVKPLHPVGVPLLCSTVAASLAVLRERGTQLVELEGHTTDAHLPALVQSLPVRGGDPMDVLMLRPPLAGTASG